MVERMILNPSYTMNAELLLNSSSKKKLDIIDYGCGNGYLLDSLPFERIGSYVGLDVSKDSLDVGKAKNLPFPNSFVHIQPENVPSLGKKDSADIVILCGVLQYLTEKEVQDVIMQAQRVLRPGGFFISSSMTDHHAYVLTNFYSVLMKVYSFFFAKNTFFPDRYINRDALITSLKNNNFSIVTAKERGFLLNPLFFNGFVILFDAVDRYLLGTRGEIGTLGGGIRKLLSPLMYLEYKLPIDYGYTLFLVAKKE